LVGLRVAGDGLAMAGELDEAVQGVADGDLAELSEGGQGGVPAGRVPGAGLALVPAEPRSRHGLVLALPRGFLLSSLATAFLTGLELLPRPSAAR